MDIVNAGTRQPLRIREYERGKCYEKRSLVLYRFKFWLALNDTTDAPPSKNWRELKGKLGW